MLRTVSIIHQANTLLGEAMTTTRIPYTQQAAQRVVDLHADAIILQLEALRRENKRLKDENPEWQSDESGLIDTLAMAACRRILKELHVYDAHVCPLCLG